MKDYYQTLGVAKSASEDEVKKAYRKLAHQHHPDKTGGDDKKFKEVNEAYQVVGNKEKRAQYDQFGATFDRSAEAPGGGFGFDPGGVQWNVNVGDMPNMNDIFESFFGGRSARGRHRGEGVRGADIEIIQEITLEDAFTGTTRTINFTTYAPCETCESKGYDASAGVDTCGTCDGSGEIQQAQRTILGNIMQVVACAACNGEGKIPKKQCDTCKGEGRIQKAHDVSLEISPGIEDGQTIHLPGKGEAGAKGGGGGDLFVHIRVKPHSAFTRQKNNLITQREISITDALLGKKIEVAEIGGTELHIMIPPGFDITEPLRVPGKGMPRFGHYRGPAARGDLYIALKLKLPTRLSRKAKKLLEELDTEL